MKNCTKCQFSNEDSATFCTNCGAKISNEEPIATQSDTPTNPTEPITQQADPMVNNFQQVQDLANTPPVQSQQPAQPYQLQQPYNPPQQNNYQQGYIPTPQYTQQNSYQQGYTDSQQPQQPYGYQQMVEPPVVQLLKSEGKSTLFLLIAIAYTASIFFGFVSNFLNSNTSSVTIPAGILVCIGLWLFYSWSKKYTTNTQSVGGLTIIKVYTILFIVVMSILIFLSSLIALITAFGGDLLLYELSDSLGAFDFLYYSAVEIIVIALLFLTALFILFLIYFIKVLRCIKTIRDSVASGLPCGKLSPFVAVMSIILGALIFFGGFGNNAFNLISSLTSAFACIAISVCMFSYNKKIEALQYNQPQQPTSF